VTTTEVIGHGIIGGEPVLFRAQATDGTAKEITVRNQAGTLVNLKDTYRGRTMTYFELDVATPSDLDLVQFKNSDGAIIYEFGGAINAALGHCPRCVAENINILIDEGCAFEITTSD